MAELKTKKNDGDVAGFLSAIEPERRRKDAEAILALMKRVTKHKPAMWGTSIIGFGTYRYKYASGREGDWFLVGFSPRKQNLTVYIMSGFEGYDALLARLGKYKTGKACLYINRIDDINLDVLEELVRESVNHVESGGVIF